VSADDFDVNDLIQDNLIDGKYIESDLFCVFTNMMIDLRDGFLRELDKEDSGM